MNKIELVDITSDNWENVCCLYPGKEGTLFVAPNSFSIAQSKYEEGWIIKAITADRVLVGFTMYGYCEELKGYEICRFMLDQHFQGKGYGKEALKVIIEEMKNNFHCNKIFLSTAPDNERGKHIYKAAGFMPTGSTCGDEDDLEDVYCLHF